MCVRRFVLPIRHFIYTRAFECYNTCRNIRTLFINSPHRANKYMRTILEIKACGVLPTVPSLFELSKGEERDDGDDEGSVESADLVDGGTTTGDDDVEDDGDGGDGVETNADCGKTLMGIAPVIADRCVFRSRAWTVGFDHTACKFHKKASFLFLD